VAVEQRLGTGDSQRHYQRTFATYLGESLRDHLRSDMGGGKKSMLEHKKRTLLFSTVFWVLLFSAMFLASAQGDDKPDLNWPKVTSILRMQMCDFFGPLSWFLEFCLGYKPNTLFCRVAFKMLP
jgi:hypothetical protein